MPIAPLLLRLSVKWGPSNNSVWCPCCVGEFLGRRAAWPQPGRLQPQAFAGRREGDTGGDTWGQGGVLWGQFISCPCCLVAFWFGFLYQLCSEKKNHLRTCIYGSMNAKHVFVIFTLLCIYTQLEKYNWVLKRGRSMSSFNTKLKCLRRYILRLGEWGIL